jgi:O6-methylguanine-DNA--protein-cysteine methyltransferase
MQKLDSTVHSVQEQLTEMEVSSAIYKTPIGPLKLEATTEGICAVKWLFGKHSKSKSDSADNEQLSTPAAKEDAKAVSAGVAVPVGSSGRANEHLEVCKAWLDAYFAGTLLESNPPKPALVLPESGML